MISADKEPNIPNPMRALQAAIAATLVTPNFFKKIFAHYKIQNQTFLPFAGRIR